VISSFHQWCISLGFWGLILWFLPAIIVLWIGVILGSIAGLWLIRLGVWAIAQKIEDRYGE
jgi:uncharacterized membrane protein YdjX (TVP38/TMEM64 family)